MRNWIDIPIFAGIDLPDSYILSWRQEDDRMSFEMLFVLTIDHALYKHPNEDEWACYRSGRLSFQNVTQCTGLPDMKLVMPATDAEGHKDYGCMDTFVETSAGQYELSGDFGAATIHAPELAIEFGPITTD